VKRARRDCSGLCCWCRPCRAYTTFYTHYIHTHGTPGKVRGTFHRGHVTTKSRGRGSSAQRIHGPGPDTWNVTEDRGGGGGGPPRGKCPPPGPPQTPRPPPPPPPRRYVHPRRSTRDTLVIIGGVFVALGPSGLSTSKNIRFV
jgi:hypothetical protein